MSESMLSVLIYLLGFIGLVSVGVLPLRSWQVLRRVFRGKLQQMPRRFLIAGSVLVTAAALWCDVHITVRIFRCLTEAYCGPAVASGWTYLAMLGAVYLAFEAVLFLLDRVAMKYFSLS